MPFISTKREIDAVTYINKRNHKIPFINIQEKANMPVPTPPYLTAIRSEFTGPNNLKAYYRNGSYVPTNQYNMSISTTESGLAVSQFSGARKDLPIELFDVNIYRHQTHQANGGSVTAAIKLDGTAEGGTSVSPKVKRTFCNLNPIPNGVIEVYGPENNGLGNPGWRDLNAPIHVIKSGSSNNGMGGSVSYIGDWTLRIKNNPSVQCNVHIDVYCGYGTYLP